MRKIVLGLLALLMTLTATLAVPRRANALPTCPVCQVNYHCCKMGFTYNCYPNSLPC